MRKKRRKKVLDTSKIKEILRLNELGMSQSEISRSSGASRSTVQDYLHRAKLLGVSFEELSSYDEAKLLEIFGKEQGTSRRKPELDNDYISRELTKKGVTLLLLWEEYFASNPDGLSYSRFCNRYTEWKKANNLSMRQHHKAGEKLYVDYAGQRLPIYRRSGSGNEIAFEAEIFVAVLGASNYLFAEATESQSSKYWLGSHCRCFEHLGGVPNAVVPDNLKSGVTKACYYDPELNISYRKLAEHYGTAILPARVRKPKDKSKVEVGVQIVERRILAQLRNRRFYSLAELNREISRLLEQVNNRKMKTYGCSRKELFELVEKAALNPLPQKRYQIFDYKLAKVNVDYHVEVEKHYYSVPYQFVHQNVEIRIKERVIEIFHENKRVALHARSNESHRHTTKKEHMPPSHKAMVKWTPERFLSWSTKIGPETSCQIKSLLDSREHPEQSYRACLGVFRLAGKFGSSRLEAACKRANSLGLCSYKRIKSILDSGLDQIPIVETKEVPPLKRHSNIRGSEYYH